MFTTLDTDFLLKLLINTVSIAVLVFGCYMKGFTQGKTAKEEVSKVDKGNRDHATSFLLFGMGVFTVTKLLHSAEISMGFAFGLFAVFSMLRYRTESISVKEMTYLFLVIAMSLLSAVSNTSLLELIILHTFFLVGAGLVEGFLSAPTLMEQEVQYEKIENIKPENHKLMIQDLKLRTGLNIQRIEIGPIDFVRDTVSLRAFYQVMTKTNPVKSELNSLKMNSEFTSHSIPEIITRKRS
tara:strand:- start:9040 stop:9756 length:717 start_codon:yes stop_codon:yes gene_type:complete